MAAVIRDDTAARRFVTEIDGHEAELVYRNRGGQLVLVHTGVPDELEGHGLGGQLVRAALAKAAAENLVVVPWCPFARAWLERHPDEAGKVTIDWTPQSST
ncbi:MAG: uncharacterized protein QOF21_426 [Actinomycetota bacterium]|jgi:predicted GNAT family acetyltransferase